MRGAPGQGPKSFHGVAPVFYDMVDDDMVRSVDEPAGERVVELICDAIEAASTS